MGCCPLIMVCCPLVARGRPFNSNFRPLIVTCCPLSYFSLSKTHFIWSALFQIRFLQLIVVSCPFIKACRPLVMVSCPLVARGCPFNSNFRPLIDTCCPLSYFSLSKYHFICCLIPFTFYFEIHFF